MSYEKDGEIHIEDDEATGASKENVVRWVLLISTFGAIVLLSIIWITGALSEGDVEEEAQYVEPAVEEDGVTVGDTDSIVSSDEMTDIDEGEEDDGAVDVIENE